MNEKSNQEIYPVKIKLETRLLYNQTITTIMKLAKSQRLASNGLTIYYYLDDAKTQVIRTHIFNRKIELSDKVDEDIIKKIREAARKN